MCRYAVHRRWRSPAAWAETSHPTNETHSDRKAATIYARRSAARANGDRDRPSHLRQWYSRSLRLTWHSALRLSTSRDHPRASWRVWFHRLVLRLTLQLG